jgi:hypothetical protein
MAFEAAFKSMGSKSGPGGKDFSVKGKEAPKPAGKVGGEEPDAGEGDHLIHAVQAAHDAEPTGKHLMVHHDGLAIRSHGIHEDGTHDGPHDHENLEALKDHMGKFFDEEENEDGGEDEPAEKNDSQHGGW